MQSDAEFFMTLNTIGATILSTTLRSAARHYFSGTTSNRMSNGKKSYIFIQGTALDYLIEDYNLEYDPEQLRNSFFYYIRRASCRQA